MKSINTAGIAGAGVRRHRAADDASFFGEHLLIVALGLVLVLAGCGSESPEPSPEARAKTADPGWSVIRAERERAREDYVHRNQDAMAWFMDMPFGRDDVSCKPGDPQQCGIPYVLLKLFPKLAPDIWGGDDNFLDVVGLFVDERVPDRPVARGVGWTGLSRDPAQLNESADHASFTCAACHLGRVRLDDESFRYLEGGINTEFNIVAYRVKVFQTISMLLGENDPSKILAMLAEAGGGKAVQPLTAAVTTVLGTLDEVHAADPTYFYRDYAYGGRRFDADYEANQVKLFQRDAAEHIGKFLGFATIEYLAFADLVAKNYQGFEKEMLQGFGGMADATGISTSLPTTLYQLDPDKFAMFAASSLPPMPGITDFMAPWEQGKRRVRWNHDRTALVDGGGQWNGNIPIPIFRTLAAELVMGYGPNTDMRIAVYSVDLLNGLPAPAYPFAVDMERAARGEALFEANCGNCHKPNNGKVYRLGTDMNRARVVDEAGTEVGRKGLTAFCSPETEVQMPDGSSTRPCAEFDGVSLAGDNYVYSFADPDSVEGYQALPLGGIWAQAPFLHNGSVPTLYHLLVPAERPDQFVKSRLDYDQNRVGFSWDPAERSRPGEGYLFDTTAFETMSNGGHDQDVTEDGQTWKLDWSDDRDGAMAIVEYMKTL